jgi:hypothetical protein
MEHHATGGSRCDAGGLGWAGDGCAGVGNLSKLTGSGCSQRRGARRLEVTRGRRQERHAMRPDHPGHGTATTTPRPGPDMLLTLPLPPDSNIAIHVLHRVVEHQFEPGMFPNGQRFVGARRRARFTSR